MPTTTAKILSISPLTTKEHPYKVKKSARQFSLIMKKLPCRFFICYQNIDAKTKLNLHIYGIHLLNPYKNCYSKPPQVSVRRSTEVRG